MFDEVTKREGGKRAARRGAWVAVSSGVQALLVVGVIVISTRIAAEVANAPVVDVKFVKQAAPPPPPPPPPAPPRKTPPRPKTDAPKPRPPAPMAMVQPKEVPQELKPPDPKEAPEPEYDEGPATGTEGGVIGGVAGSTAAAPQGGGIEDAPVYASAGFKQPGEVQRGCVGQSVRIPRDLAGIVSTVTVKFAVNRDGSVSSFQVMGSQPDPRIGQAIWQAIQNCRFTAGADAQGRPVAIWLILPLRFVSG